MLTKSAITTMLPVSDVDRASRFYAECLGLSQTGTGPDGSPIFAAGMGDAIGLLPAEAGAQSTHTVLSFEVDDVKAEIADLEGRGVHFEDYDTPELRTVDHIADMGGEKAAWFTDSEGNILCLHQTG
ncbi:VOC family protein [Actinokineospora sp. HUAS TT18]|uniref:VOC family protein n=1 Tax=Actinokineospora sp. HUAS TT18 TaxID=3447451 RepID=UPI003F51EB31